MDGFIVSHIWLNNSFYGKGGCIFPNKNFGISMGEFFLIVKEFVEVINSFVAVIGTISKDGKVMGVPQKWFHSQPPSCG